MVLYTPVEVRVLSSHTIIHRKLLTAGKNMIFVFLFLLVADVFSFSADFWQQDMLAYRLEPYPRPPHFSSGHLRPANDVMCLGLRDWADISTNCNNDPVELLKLMTANTPNEKMVDDSIEGRSKNNYKSKNNGGKDTSPMMDRSFGFKFLGFNALANYLINSVSYTITSTSYSTSYSTLTIGTVATCYTSTMFFRSTPCERKKRELSSSSSSIIIGDDYDVQKGIDPSLVQGIEATFSDGVNIIVQREGKSFFDNIQRILQSSMSDGTLNNENKKEPMISPRKFGYAEEFLENLPGETLYVSASTITSFVLYTTTATRTVTNLAGNRDLFCLPSCFTLC